MAAKQIVLTQEGLLALEEELEKAIKAENYELAAKIRDQINVRNQNQ